MPRVFIGETRLPKDFKRYTRQFSLLELDTEPGNLPGKAKLQACAALAPEDFVFSLVVPQRVAALEPGAETDKAWKAAENVARVLRAKWWVVRTPPNVRPTRRTREELASLFGRLGSSGMRVAWEPRGVWEQAAAAATAAEVGVHLIQDIAREDPLGHGVVYSRLLALGRGARIGLSVADAVVQRARAFEEAYVVVEGQGAREIVRALGLDAPDEEPEGPEELEGLEEPEEPDEAELEEP